MPSTLRYGIDSRVEFDLPDEVLITECGIPHSAPIGDVAAVTAARLRDPLEYPPLSKATTPADRIVLAVEPGVPQVETVIAEVVQCLVEAGVDPDGLTVLRTAADIASGREDPCRNLPEALKGRIAVVTHEPEDRRKMAYLAATGRGTPILLNRMITDADVVVPIGRVGNASSPGYRGVNGIVFPTFSDLDTQRRFRSPPAAEAGSSHHAESIEECNEVGWLLGAAFSLSVVPGRGEEVLDIVAGETGAVGRRSRELYDSAWTCTVPCKASLVIAAIEGGPSQQTWENVGAALGLARGLVEDEGAIAICCGLSSAPGPAIQQLIGARSRHEAMRHIRRERPEDLLYALQLTEALDIADVYLLSRLDESMVEDLEVAPIGDPAELVRLAQRHRSCILVSNASHAMVALQNGVV
ncbi:MAG: DUF2088 domain-containing protein [Rhodopirellula sp.]|nr:DUF2088 domain-containing protein [Rhodopirellula sp.]